MRNIVALALVTLLLPTVTLGQTSLLEAPAIVEMAKIGDVQAVRSVLVRGGRVSDTDAEGMTATMHAAKAGYADVVALLLVARLRGVDPVRFRRSI